MKAPTVFVLPLLLMALSQCNQNQPGRNGQGVPEEGPNIGGLDPNHLEVGWEEVEMMRLDSLGMKQDYDYLVFINPDSTITYPIPQPDTCSFFVMFQTSESVTVPQCDSQFDYQSLFSKAYNQAKGTMQGWQCPGDCPQERYNRPLPNYWVGFSCVPQMDGTKKQYVTVQLYMLCEIQN
ncbi:MAG TPA: hypothetical protein DCR93_23510 [Cytophagales bacterium]|nr:hypothetical protein [Cytophagales bacterium]HAP62335.1 hypothetical protein [Cytophagales bacterium]